jgi:hypothetical protein
MEWEWYRDFIISHHAEEKLATRQPLSASEARAWVNNLIREIAWKDSQSATL